MRSKSAITTNLAQEPSGTEGVLDTTGERDPDKISAKESFSRGITATTKAAKQVAFELGMSDQLLSDYRNMQRIVAFWAVKRLCRKNPNTAAPTIAADLLEGSDFEVVRKRKVNKKVAREQMRLQLERNADIFDLVAEKAARAIGASKQDVIDAWNAEDTGAGDEQ